MFTNEIEETDVSSYSDDSFMVGYNKNGHDVDRIKMFSQFGRSPLPARESNRAIWIHKSEIRRHIAHEDSMQKKYAPMTTIRIICSKQKEHN